MPFLSPNKQRQSNEDVVTANSNDNCSLCWCCYDQTVVVGGKAHRSRRCWLHSAQAWFPARSSYNPKVDAARCNGSARQNSLNSRRPSDNVVAWARRRRNRHLMSLHSPGHSYICCSTSSWARLKAALLLCSILPWVAAVIALFCDSTGNRCFLVVVFVKKSSCEYI